MKKNTTATKSYLTLFQLLDSSFPSGSFIHSFGLEAYILSSNVKNSEDLKTFLQNIVYDIYMQTEFVCMRDIYEAMEEQNIQKIIKIDKNFKASLSYEYAKATKDIGENYLLHVKRFLKTKTAKECKNLGLSEIALLSILSHELNIDLKDFMLLWAKKSLQNIAFGALKISTIKPSSIQQVLFDMDEILSSIDTKNIPKKMTNFNPLHEEIIFTHKTLEPKMFAT